VREALRDDPARSDRAIAEATNTSRPFVGRVRAEEGGNAPTPAERKSRSGKIGEGQHKVAPHGEMPDLPPELDRRAKRGDQPAEREMQGLPPVKPKTDWGLFAALMADFVRDYIADKFKILPPEYHTVLLRKVRQVLNQLDKERKVALERIDEAAS
jgi:hypothetical protein